MYSRCVEAVNFTHNPQHAQMDVKLRSLICLGLNEQVSYGNIGCGVSCSGIQISYIFLWIGSKKRPFCCSWAFALF